MYNESYEEYIRSILGYPNYNNSNFENDEYYSGNIYRNIEQTNKIESCYPEIYKIVYPMITKACASNQRTVTPELIDELTDEIYNSLESNNEIQVNINLNNEITSNNRSSSTNNQTYSNEKNLSTNSKIVSNNRNSLTNNENKKELVENRNNNRQFKNNSFRDLIKILLIRELLGNNNRPNRPPTIRPPFQYRPPIMPRYDI